MASSFYVYLWLREDGVPYYVGKGTGYRAKERSGHSVHKPTEECRIVIQNYESETEAFEAEKFFIAYFGRVDLSEGCLRNLTNGGEGTSGAVRSAQSRMHQSILKKGKRLPQWHRDRISAGQMGRTFSEDTRKKISFRLSGKAKSEEHRKNIGIAQRNRLASKIKNF